MREKKQATFISGINCIKGVELKKQTATLSQEVAAVDFGLDLAANESRSQTEPNPNSPRTCRDLQANRPARIAQLAAHGPHEWR